jgi:glycosyltransferase involved in cell wall biosynthesis
MSKTPLASVIVSSYNYGHFLKAAIDSALNQTYPDTEVIVVDDGSADDSRDVIAGYGSRVRALLKENGGQASAFNAGFRLSRGEVIVFLDSDDFLLPTAVQRAVGLFTAGNVAKGHWPLWVVDEQGRKTGEVLPHEPLGEGELRAAVLEAGANGYSWPPTSGNCWSRAFLEAIGPLPEEPLRTSPDFYLAALAPLYGLTKAVLEPHASFRIHGSNHGWLAPMAERLEARRRLEEHTLEALDRHCRALGIAFDPEVCRSNFWSTWLEELNRVAHEIATVVPMDVPYLLVDEAKWHTDARDLTLPGRPIPFPEQNGEYAGLPADDESALTEFERLRHAGAGFLVFGWPAFWWLDYYEGLHRQLRSEFRCVLENERLVIFDVRQGSAAVPPRARVPRQAC